MKSYIYVVYTLATDDSDCPDYIQYHILKYHITRHLYAHVSKIFCKLKYVVKYDKDRVRHHASSTKHFCFNVSTTLHGQAQVWPFLGILLFHKKRGNKK
jgi:hypothetical protein